MSGYQARGSGSGSGIARNSPTPRSPSEEAEYNQLFQLASNNVKQIATNVATISNICPQIGTAKDSQQLRDKLRETVDSTREIAADVLNELKSLSHLDGHTQDEQSKRKRALTKLNKDFQTYLAQFQDIIKVSAEKEKKAPVPTQKVAPQAPSTQAWGKSSYSASAPFIMPPQETQVDETQALLDQQKKQQYLVVDNQREFNDMMIRQRDEGIRDIEAALSDVNDIFRDLATLVVEQGTLIDNIESNIEQANAKTIKGVQELKVASNEQRKARTKMCCIALIVVLVAAAAVVLIVIGVKFF